MEMESNPVIIIAIAFVLLIPFSAFGQESLDCPKGTYHGLDNQGNEACRDIQTNQIVDPNTGIMTVRLFCKGIKRHMLQWELQS